jgi:hypothetical protein
MVPQCIMGHDEAFASSYIVLADDPSYIEDPTPECFYRGALRYKGVKQHSSQSSFKGQTWFNSNHSHSIDVVYLELVSGKLMPVWTYYKVGKVNDVINGFYENRVEIMGKYTDFHQYVDVDIPRRKELWIGDITQSN